MAILEVSEALQRPYAPRNALNADELRAAIRARSEARGDEPAIAAWLLNHFYRHAVGNFEPARRIESLDDARRALGAETLPPWLEARFGAPGGATPEIVLIVWVDPADPQLLLLETRLVELLSSRWGTALDGKLARINCPQALALWQKEHADMAARIERGWRQSRPEALRAVSTIDGRRFVEFLPDSPWLRSEMAFESYMMRHCLGQFANRRALNGGYGEHYAQSTQEGRMRLFSLRDAHGQPHMTVSILVDKDGTLTVEQVKGKQNRPPVERYVGDLIACLNALGTDGQIPADCAAIGVVRTESGWQRMAEVTDADRQARLVSEHPALFDHLGTPSPLVEWLAAARQPTLFAGKPPRSPALRYALRSNPGKAGTVAYQTEGVPWPDLDATKIFAARPAAQGKP